MHCSCGCRELCNIERAARESSCKNTDWKLTPRSSGLLGGGRDLGESWQRGALSRGATLAVKQRRWGCTQSQSGRPSHLPASMTMRVLAVLLLASRGGALLPAAPLRAAIIGAPRAVAPLRPLRVPPLCLSSSDGKVSPPPNRMQRMVQKMSPTQADGSRKPLPQWARQLVKVLIRLRPLFPAFFILMLLIMQTMRRSSAAPRPVELTYAAFMKLVEAKGSGQSLTDVRVSLTRISFLLDGKAAFTRPVRAPDSLIWFLHRSGVDFRAAATSAATVLLPLLFPCLWLAAVYTMMRRQMGGATGSVGKKGAALRLSADDLSFEDVAGIDSAKEEVQEIVTMLKSPSRYAAAGARLPAGVLMVGPPGTGKTLLARVMAAQAEVPFFYCSGSDFVELFVGRGAARMRALFKEAAAAAPCLIFVDELDALGKQRSLRIGGSNDEVEQTLNQMLACMDGVDSSNNDVVRACHTLRANTRSASTAALTPTWCPPRKWALSARARAFARTAHGEGDLTCWAVMLTVHAGALVRRPQVVMGATNRYEILDPALTRPGRFDRLVRISLPDASGRLAILKVHTRRLKLAPNVNLQVVAEAATGYSGAEIAALANEAAIRAVRRNTEEVVQADFLAAVMSFNSARRRVPSVESLLPKWLKDDQSESPRPML